MAADPRRRELSTKEKTGLVAAILALFVASVFLFWSGQQGLIPRAIALPLAGVAPAATIPIVWIAGRQVVLDLRVLGVLLFSAYPMSLAASQGAGFQQRTADEIVMVGNICLLIWAVRHFFKNLNHHP